MSGRVAIVTGASRGIGAAIATEFGRHGASVLLTARSSQSAPGALPGTLEEVAAELEAHGTQVAVVSADLAKADDRVLIVETALERFGRVDVLVNNAAVTYFQPLSTLSLSRVSLMHEIQVIAPLHLSQLVLPQMRERGEGWILNITSAESRHPRIPPGRFASKGTTTGYGMAKSALERMTSGLAAETYADGVSISALYPSGLVPTPGILFHGVITADDPAAEDPAIMARAAALLCTSPVSEYSGGIFESTKLLAASDEAATLRLPEKQ